MHDGMPYGSIQSQGQGNVALKGISKSVFSTIFNGSWKMTADS